MIFVTVGTQLPFDRMVRTVDQWAGAHSYGEVFAQIGPAQYRPKHIRWAEFLDADECRRKIEQADVVVAHAGMGSILTALELGKPILVMPRLAKLGEHRNDHQLATAKHFLAQGRIMVAFDERELLEKLEYLGTLRPTERIAAHASPALLAALRAFIDGKELPPAGTASASQEPLRVTPGSPLRWQPRTSEDAPTHGTPAHLLARPEPVGRTYAAAHIRPRLRAMILLAGRLRPTDLSRRAGRSRLDLPIDQERSILGFWRDEAVDLAHAWHKGNLPVRVLLDQASTMPTLPPVLPGVTITLERDQMEFRGTGGVLRDACADYDDDDWVLVANAAQLLFGSLRSVMDQLAEAGGEINVVQDREGIPNGLMLLRCGVLRGVSAIGFHDMKEQAIPLLAKNHTVKVVATAGLTSHPIHSLQDFTEALRAYHAGRSLGRTDAAAPAERWQKSFAICEPGAVIAPTAILHDSVILRGAIVEKGAVVVRSLVGQGARVRAGEKVFDQIVT